MKTDLIKRKYGFDAQNLVFCIFKTIAIYITNREVL